MPGPQGAPRADIIRLLAAGYPDRAIGRELRTATKRIRRIRAELQLPPARANVLTLEQKWATYALATDDGHLEWVGPRGTAGTPIVCHGNRRHQARAIAFRQQYRRDPVGQVRPGCGAAWCVAPAHVADQPMRAQLDTQYAAIFGEAA
ncbi:hypothetical protein [Streptomyces sp. NPDC002088]|uniref:hypothetical protein n=1 Tax=Streptomyces sp. NPDC002088 TaxID=3154665 RepID=UPI00332355CB